MRFSLNAVLTVKRRVFIMYEHITVLSVYHVTLLTVTESLEQDYFIRFYN